MNYFTLIPKDITKIILKDYYLFDTRFVAKVRSICKLFHEIMEEVFFNTNLVRLWNMHYVWLDSVNDLPIDTEKHRCVDWYKKDEHEMQEYLHTLGYKGEGMVMLKDIETDRYIMMNNFYANWEHDDWMDFFNNLKKESDEYDFKWKCYDYPRLGGNKRVKIWVPNFTESGSSFVTFHRGSCLWVSWTFNKIKE